MRVLDPMMGAMMGDPADMKLLLVFTVLEQDHKVVRLAVPDR